MTRAVPAAAAAVVALGLGIGIGSAAVTGERWEAESTTALSITGDVTFAPTRITFQTGAFLDLRPLGVRAIGTPYDDARSHARVRLYRILTRTVPVLLHGNVICSPAPTYLAVAYEPSDTPPDSRSVFAGFYEGRASPRHGAGNALCAAFTYVTR